MLQCPLRLTKELELFCKARVREDLPAFGLRELQRLRC